MKPTDLKCYPQVVAVIGEELADYELQRVIDADRVVNNKDDVWNSFVFTESPQKERFWALINKGQSPYDHGHEKPEVKYWQFVSGAWHKDWDETPCGLIERSVYSVTMPDWVPDIKKLTSDEDKRTSGIHSNSEIYLDGAKDWPPTFDDGDLGAEDKERSDGSTASYYELPEGATELQHLISHRNLNAQLGEIFRACYRYGLVSHSDMLRDAKKIKFYAQAEIERLEKLASASE